MKDNSKNSELKNNYIPFEIIFSVIIILSTIIIVAIVSLNIARKAERVNKEAKAILLISNIIENIQTRSYDNFEEYINNLSMVGVSKSYEITTQIVSINGEELTESIFGQNIPDNYDIEFKIENLSKDFNIMKNITIEVYYDVNGNVESESISTTLEKEMVDRCNEPNMSSNYFSNVVEGEKYEIVPIKYSDETNSYTETYIGDTRWYNYSAKKWAKVLIFTDSSLKEKFIKDNGEIEENVDGKNIYDYMYVWIPNFSKRSGKTFFRYGASKNIIRIVPEQATDYYLYLNGVSDVVDDISDECKFEGITGVWVKVSETSNNYFKEFNNTKYGPLDLH